MLNPLGLKVPQNTFLPQVESLRGLAALTVVFGHCYLWGPYRLPKNALGNVTTLIVEALLDPQPPVLLFFVISGFVLGIQLHRQPAETALGYFAYAVRRIFRLVPAMWVAVLFAFALAVIFGEPPDFGLGKASPLDAKLILSTLFLHNLGLNVVLWSLSVEFVCCTLFPILYWAHIRTGTRGNLVILTGLIALSYQPQIPFSLQFLVCFHVGLLVSLAQRRGFLSNSSLGWAAFAIGTIGYIWTPEIVMGQKRNWFILNLKDWMWLEWPCCFLLLLYVVRAKAGLVLAFLSSPPVRFLGRVSYSLYLLHFPIVLAVLIQLNQMGYTTSLGLSLALITIVMTISLPLAALSYYFIERPFIRAGRRLADLITARFSTGQESCPARPQ
jgi:peptidoglycan/LPS O-acetylase OafA/YrhL